MLSFREYLRARHEMDDEPELTLLVETKSTKANSVGKLVQAHKKQCASLKIEASKPAINVKTFNQFRENIIQKTAVAFPAELVLRRVAIRQFPDGKSVAVYADPTTKIQVTIPQVENA